MHERTVGKILKKEKLVRKYRVRKITYKYIRAERKPGELVEKVGITMADISVLKNGKAKAIRLSTLEAICKALECQPGDILEYNRA